MKYFTVSYHPGSLQQANWFPTTGIQLQHTPLDNENTVPSPPQVSSIHFTYTPAPSNTDPGSSASQRDFNADNNSQLKQSRSQEQQTVPNIPRYQETRLVTSQREARKFDSHNIVPGPFLPQTFSSRSEEQKLVPSLTNTSPYKERGSVPSQEEAKYRNSNPDNDKSTQSLPQQTLISRPEEQGIVSSLSNNSQYGETRQGSPQREEIHRNLNYNNVKPTQIPISKFGEQRVPPSLSSTSQYQDTRFSSQREARYRDFNTDNNSGQSVPQLFIGSETQRTVGNAPVYSSSQHHKAGPEKRLPDAYTNNPFFQSLINRVTPPSVISGQPNKPEQNEPHSVSKVLPITLEDARESFPQTPSNPGRVKEFSIYYNNSETKNGSPSVREQKSFRESYPDNPFFQSVSGIVPTTGVPISSDVENENDLNNIVELHILDPRKMFYIPESKNHEIHERNSTVLLISVPTPLHNNSHGFMNFRNNVKSLQGKNPQCPRCHPAFLSPGKCQPCVIIR